MSELTLENIALVTNFLDSCLDGTIAEEFGTLLDTGGIHGIMRLCEKIHYKRSEELINLAIKKTFENFASCTKGKRQVDFAFGARHPKSDKFSWNNAVVFCKAKGDDSITAAVFQNGMDYIGHPNDYNDVVKQYKAYLGMGWKPMDKEDIEKTSGITIDKDTKTTPNRKIHPIKSVIMIGTIACALFLLKRMR